MVRGVGGGIQNMIQSSQSALRQVTTSPFFIVCAAATRSRRSSRIVVLQICTAVNTALTSLIYSVFISSPSKASTATRVLLISFFH